ncbi:unnamed protein product [Thlaspi arvense]|uniref:Uncharacterized protein n=1 Tax=Thlaspi arvense TaxID=13288 RepID=A0AAU9SB58_THLAR|nr:unnamed protein product [Thlaspi arvense]
MASMLSVLALSHNELTGSFPLVGNLTKLTVLKFSYNHFSGTLNSKSSLFDLLELRQLSLAFNNFSSSLPFEFGNLNKLETLSLSSNGFFELDLHGNQFNGSIEHLNSSSLSRLELLYLGNVDLEGKILEPISKFTTLKSLDLSFLKTSYPMDLSLLSSFKFLEWLDMSGLQMEEQRVLTSYATIDFSGNLLEGQIPESIGLLKALIALNLSNNDLTGHIPSSLANISELESLDLLGNQLSGTRRRSIAWIGNDTSHCFVQACVAPQDLIYISFQTFTYPKLTTTGIEHRDIKLKSQANKNKISLYHQKSRNNLEPKQHNKETRRF